MTELEEKARALLRLPVAEPEEAEKLKAMKVKRKDRDNATLLAAVLLDKAKKGDIPAIKELRALTGREKEPADGQGKLDELIEGLKETEKE